MADKGKIDHGAFMLIIALVGWVIPGGGHYMINEKKRAGIIFVTVTFTFLLGLYVGSIGVIDPVGGRIWYMGQMMASPFVGIIGNITQQAQQGTYDSFGKPFEIGQIYTTVAGMLNLLCIISAVYMSYSGRGEIIGTEEEENA